MWLFQFRWCGCCSICGIPCDRAIHRSGEWQVKHSYINEVSLHIYAVPNVDLCVYLLVSGVCFSPSSFMDVFTVVPTICFSYQVCCCSFTCSHCHMPYCTVICHIVLSYAILYCYLPYCTAICHIVLPYAILDCHMPYWTVICHPAVVCNYNCAPNVTATV